MWEIFVTLKFGKKNRFFSRIFSKLVWNFGVSSAPVYGEWAFYRLAAKKLGDFLGAFLPEGAEFFIGRFLKVHWRFTVDHTGMPFTPFGRGKAVT